MKFRRLRRLEIQITFAESGRIDQQTTKAPCISRSEGHEVAFRNRDREREREISRGESIKKEKKGKEARVRVRALPRKRGRRTRARDDAREEGCGDRTTPFSLAEGRAEQRRI